MMENRGHLFENQDVHYAVENEETAHGNVLRVKKEGILCPPPSQELGKDSGLIWMRIFPRKP